MYPYVFLDLKNICLDTLFDIVSYLQEEIWECIHLAAILDAILDFSDEGINSMNFK